MGAGGEGSGWDRNLSEYAFLYNSDFLSHINKYSTSLYDGSNISSISSTNGDISSSGLRDIE